MQRILETGHKGFIGAKVKERLGKIGHNVVGYDIIDGDDLHDLKNLEEKIKQVDIVFHIAAAADLTKMFDIEGGRKGVLDNVEATHNVAYLCAKHKKWLIYASTMCVYGNLHPSLYPAREDNTLPNPSEIYACAKYAAEWVIKGYGKNFGLPWTILRFATIYGEGMREALSTYIFFRQALKNEDITIHGDGSQTRTLTYIHDLVDGIVAPIENPEKAKGHIFNLSTTEPVSVMKMAEDIKKLTGSKSRIVFTPQRQNQTFHEHFDTSKAKELLGWEARTSWEEGLIKTYEWMKTLDF
ncbi:MAG: NAD-dependent epimerase/dehydratase family protein [bacterium]|nr:NAD-dependent epimerase/dehydratase family protein [bacterium]